MRNLLADSFRLKLTKISPINWISRFFKRHYRIAKLIKCLRSDIYTKELEIIKINTKLSEINFNWKILDKSIRKDLQDLQEVFHKNISLSRGFGKFLNYLNELNSVDDLENKLSSLENAIQKVIKIDSQVVKTPTELSKQMFYKSKLLLLKYLDKTKLEITYWKLDEHKIILESEIKYINEKIEAHSQKKLLFYWTS